MPQATWVRWLIAAIVVLGIVALLAWAHGEPGVGGRIPDLEDASATVAVLAGVRIGS